MPEKSPTGATLNCPSSHPGKQGAFAYGIVSGTAEAPQLRYLPAPIPLGNVTDAAEVAFVTTKARIAAPCDGRLCSNFDGVGCRLPKQIVTALPVVADAPPRCILRPTCVWFHQEGVEACLRCPQIVSSDEDERVRGAFRDSVGG